MSHPLRLFFFGDIPYRNWIKNTIFDYVIDASFRVGYIKGKLYEVKVGYDTVGLEPPQALEGGLMVGN